MAKRVVADLIGVFGIAPVDEAVILRALTSRSRDFEDAVRAASAEAAACEAIVTRDPGGFPSSPLAGRPQDLLDIQRLEAIVKAKQERGDG